MAFLLNHKALQEGWLMLSCLLLASMGVRDWLFQVLVRLFIPLYHLAVFKLDVMIARISQGCLLRQ